MDLLDTSQMWTIYLTEVISDLWSSLLPLTTTPIQPADSIPQCLLQLSMAQESPLHVGVQADLHLQVHQDLKFVQVTSDVKSVQELLFVTES